jgi:hypothetical protein
MQHKHGPLHNLLVYFNSVVLVELCLFRFLQWTFMDQVVVLLVCLLWFLAGPLGDFALGPLQVVL